MQSADQISPSNGYHHLEDETEPQTSAKLTTVDNYQVASTPDHSTVDAFEYEPMGYMSKGRW